MGRLDRRARQRRDPRVLVKGATPPTPPTDLTGPNTVNALLTCSWELEQHGDAVCSDEAVDWLPWAVVQRWIYERSAAARSEPYDARVLPQQTPLEQTDSWWQRYQHQQRRPPQP